MEPLVVLLVVAVVWMLLLSGAVGLSLWALSRHNRIRTDRPTAAPLSWVWSPSRAARLHRRLRAAAGWVDGEPSPAHDHLRTLLVDQAVDLDLAVVHAARAPRSHRRRMLADVARRVGEVERLAVRVHALADPRAGRWATRVGPTPEVADSLARLREHVTLLEDANAELADLEGHAGLDQVRSEPAPAVQQEPAPRQGRSQP